MRFRFRLIFIQLVGLLHDPQLTFILGIAVVSAALWTREGAIRDAWFGQSN